MLERLAREGRTPTAAIPAAAEMVADALEDLRDLARGIYPPLLADRGLAVALDAQARKAAVPTSVDADGIGRYPQQVEAAVYFCALEALQNVAKYAGAPGDEVRLERRRQARVRGADDGPGFDSGTPAGSGLQGMADRLDAIGGALRVRSQPGHGTILSGELPLAAPGHQGLGRDVLPQLGLACPR